MKLHIVTIYMFIAVSLYATCCFGQNGNSNPNFIQLRKQYYSNKESMTKAAFKAWWAQTIEDLQSEEQIQGVGYIDEADTNWSNEIEIIVNVYPSESQDGKDEILYKLYINEEEGREIVAAFHRDDKIEFAGKLLKIDVGWSSFSIEIGSFTVLSTNEYDPERADLIIPETSTEQFTFLNFIEFQKKYDVNERRLTKYGFDLWHERLEEAFIGNKVLSQGVIVEAKDRNDTIVDVLIDLHGDRSEDVVLKMNKHDNTETIQQLSKEEAVEFGGEIEKLKLTSKKVSIQIVNGQIITFLAKNHSEGFVQDDDGLKELSKNDITVEFDQGFLNDSLVLTNDSNYNLYDVAIEVTLDNGDNVTDSIPVWLNYGEKKYEFSTAKRPESLDIRFSCHAGAFTETYRTGYIRPTPKPTPLNTPTISTKVPSVSTSKPRVTEIEVNIHSIVVKAETLIENYIVENHGFARKYIKFGNKLANSKISNLGENHYSYTNSLRYRNAFGADMEGNVHAIIQYDGNIWILKELDIR